MIKLDRTIWEKEYISNKSKAAWRCSKCWSGFLQISNTYQKTKRSHSSILLKCTNLDCKKIYVVSGKMKHYSRRIEVNANYFNIDDFRLYPSHFLPELHIFKLPLKIDPLISEKLQLSFNHFWYDFDACANKIRQSLELIIKDKGGIGANLHKQIESLRDVIGNDLTEALLALKWIGNEGSHPEKPFTRNQLLDTYELLVDVLNELYPDNSEIEKRKKFVESANKNKGIKNT